MASWASFGTTTKRFKTLCVATGVLALLLIASIILWESRWSWAPFAYSVSPVIWIVVLVLAVLGIAYSALMAWKNMRRMWWIGLAGMQAVVGSFAWTFALRDEGVVPVFAVYVGALICAGIMPRRMYLGRHRALALPTFFLSGSLISLFSALLLSSMRYSPMIDFTVVPTLLIVGCVSMALCIVMGVLVLTFNPKYHEMFVSPMQDRVKDPVDARC